MWAVIGLASDPSDVWTFSAGGSATAVGQYGVYENAVSDSGGEVSDTGRGSLAIDLEAGFTNPAGGSGLISGSFAEGNGLNGAGGVSLSINADDLESDVKGINGHNRDYLLEAWYQQRFELSNGLDLELTGGLIDPTRYLDLNDYANDEVTQFMNEAFVNRLFIPSYDPGLRIGFSGDTWQVDLVWLDSRRQNPTGQSVGFDFYAAGISMDYESALGPGELNVDLQTTSRSFGRGGNSRVPGAALSISQSLGDALGVFARTALLRDDESAAVHRGLISAGLSYDLALRNAQTLSCGFAFAHLAGLGDETGDIRNTLAVESFARWDVSGRASVTFDLQYVEDRLRRVEDPGLWAFSLRTNFLF
jgi:porin